MRSTDKLGDAAQASLKALRASSIIARFAELIQGAPDAGMRCGAPRLTEGVGATCLGTKCANRGQLAETGVDPRKLSRPKPAPVTTARDAFIALDRIAHERHFLAAANATDLQLLESEVHGRLRAMVHECSPLTLTAALVPRMARYLSGKSCVCLRAGRKSMHVSTTASSS